MNRIRAGYCTVPNPMNPQQVSRISLAPEDLTAIVFWTRNPTPLLDHLAELDGRGYRYYFQFTLLDNPRELDQKTPSLKAALSAFHTLANRISPRRVIWRYDPIVLSSITPPRYHVDKYEEIASQLAGSTQRSIISIVDHYKKIGKRFSDLRSQGIEIYDGEAVLNLIDQLLPDIMRTAQKYGLEIQSCAEILNLTSYQICPGKCVDDQLIESLFGISTTAKKDPGQREACGCIPSRDIGMYDSCLFGCQYCYATSSFDRSRKNHRSHDPNSPSLIGHYDVEPPLNQQLTLPW